MRWHSQLRHIRDDNIVLRQLSIQVCRQDNEQKQEHNRDYDVDINLLKLFAAFAFDGTQPPLKFAELVDTVLAMAILELLLLVIQHHACPQIREDSVSVREFVLHLGVVNAMLFDLALVQEDSIDWASHVSVSELLHLLVFLVGRLALCLKLLRLQLRELLPLSAGHLNR